MRSEFNLVRTVTDTFSVPDGTVIAGLIAMAMLLLFAVVVVVHVVLVSHDRKITFRSAMKHAFSTLWAVPVLAVLACFGYRAADHLQAANRPPEANRQVGADRSGSTSGRAKPEFTPHRKAPEWARTASDLSLVASSHSDVIVARGASVADAETKLAAIARKRLFENVDSNQHRPGDSSLLLQASDRSIKAHAVRRRFEQPGTEKVRVRRPGGTDIEYSNTVYQVYWQLDRSDSARNGIRQDAAAPRLWLIGGLIGLLTLIAAAVATYLRLDARTAGKYRTRLKFATTSFIVAAGMLLTALLPIA